MELGLREGSPSVTPPCHHPPPATRPASRAPFPRPAETPGCCCCRLDVGCLDLCVSPSVHSRNPRPRHACGEAMTLTLTFASLAWCSACASARWTRPAWCRTIWRSGCCRRILARRIRASSSSPRWCVRPAPLVLRTPTRIPSCIGVTVGLGLALNLGWG